MVPLNLDEKPRYLPLIRNVLPLRFLDPRELELFFAACELEIYEAGEKIISQGEINQDFFAVLRGQVQVSVIEESGREVYICTIGAFEVFGEAGMFLQVKRTANVSALDHAVVLRVPRNRMMAFIKKHPVSGNKFLLLVIHSLLRKLREASQELAYERQMDADQLDVDAIVREFGG